MEAISRSFGPVQEYLPCKEFYFMLGWGPFFDDGINQHENRFRIPF